MKLFLEMPFLFWYSFLFTFLFCTGMQAFLQVWFLLKLSHTPAKIHYYAIYISIAYLIYIMEMTVQIEQGMFSKITSLLTGVAVIFIFSTKLLKQNTTTSLVMSVLLITTNVLAESIITPIQSICTMSLAIPAYISNMLISLLLLAITYLLLLFFSKKYHLRSQGKSKYLWILAAPMLFIDIIMRTLIEFKYFPNGTNNNALLEFTARQNYEFWGLSILAFACVCGMLFTYDKFILFIEAEHQKTILLTQLAIQKNYVSESKARYEATRAFRHDLKNHIIALKGMAEKNDQGKIISYLNRFEQISNYITFPIHTGNLVMDILLGEKLSHAKGSGILITHDISISPAIQMDDFDLCVIFANAIDNAIKACTYKSGQPTTLDIVAKQNKNFFIIDIVNSCEKGNVKSGTQIGLSSVKMIVDKYQGAIDIVSEQDFFRLSILLPLPKQ